MLNHILDLFPRTFKLLLRQTQTHFHSVGLIEVTQDPLLSKFVINCQLETAKGILLPQTIFFRDYFACRSGRVLKKYFGFGIRTRRVLYLGLMVISSPKRTHS